MNHVLINKYQGISNCEHGPINLITTNLPNVYVVDKNIVTILYYKNTNEPRMCVKDSRLYRHELPWYYNTLNDQTNRQKHCSFCGAYKTYDNFCGYLGKFNICGECIRFKEISYLSIGNITVNNEPLESNPEPKACTILKSNIIAPYKVGFKLTDISYITILHQPWLI